MSDSFKRGLRRCLVASQVILALLTVLGFSSCWWQPGDLATHFRVQYFWGLLLGAVVLAALRRWLAAGLTAIFVLVNLATIVPLYWPVAARPTPGPKIRIASLNVYSANRRHDDVAKFVRRSQADLVLLLEVTGGWQDLFDALADDYPYRQIETRSDNFGIALISRHPFDSVETRDLGSADVPSIIARVRFGEQQLTLIGTHPLPPVSPELWRLRNGQFAALAQRAGQESGPLVLLGDLNTTSWSAHFNSLLAGTRLRDSRRGFGVCASWPQGSLPARIPIDHCLVSPELVVLDRQVGPDVGSDHFPIVIDLGFTEEAPRSLK